jgi:hypothetical protein
MRLRERFRKAAPSMAAKLSATSLVCEAGPDTAQAIDARRVGDRMAR